MYEIGMTFIVIGSMVAILGFLLAVSPDDSAGIPILAIGLMLLIFGGSIEDSAYRKSLVGKEQLRNTELKRQIEDRLENQETYKNRKIYLKKLKEENKRLEDSLKRL